MQQVCAMLDSLASAWLFSSSSQGDPNTHSIWGPFSEQHFVKISLFYTITLELLVRINIMMIIEDIIKDNLG